REFVLEIRAQVDDQFVERRIWHLHEPLHRGAAAEPDQPGLLEIGKVHEHARANAERAEAAPGLRLDHAADREALRSDRQPITDRRATMAPTPMAMQTKKNNSRFHDERISRPAMSRTNLIPRRPPPRGHHAGPAGRRRPPRRSDRASPAPAWHRASVAPAEAS